MDLELSVVPVAWGSGAVLDAAGREIGRVRIEPHDLTPDQRQAYEQIRAAQEAADRATRTPV